MRIGAFTYNFPHYKTQQGLLNLVANGFKPELMMSQDFKKLDLPSSEVRVVPRYEYLHHPTHLARHLYIANYIGDHNDAVELIKQSELDVGIVLGARILPKEVIRAFKIGIINAHPGLIPHNRGLDNLKWAIRDRLPQAVTAHLISPKIDSGRIIIWEIANIYEDDTLIDIHIRLQELEQKLIISALRLLSDPRFTPRKVTSSGKYNKVMSVGEEAEMMRGFDDYKRDYYGIVHGLLNTLSPEELP